MDRLLYLTCIAALLAGCMNTRTPDDSRPPTGFPLECTPAETQVMLLGTYHFANPGNDAVNPVADDVLAPHRQAELQQLADRLARWRPDQIAVEAPYADSVYWHRAYERYRSDSLAPNRNEIVQIGFRLADQLGHRRVYPIDHQMRIGNDSVAVLYERRPEFEALGDSIRAVLQARTDSMDAVMMETSIVEHLRHANSEEGLHGGNSFGMFGALMPVGEGENYGGPSVIARWYERNILMAHHLHRIRQPQTDRILVVVGSGHVPPMRSILDEDPRFCPVSPLPYLQSPDVGS